MRLGLYLLLLPVARLKRWFSPLLRHAGSLCQAEAGVLEFPGVACVRPPRRTDVRHRTAAAAADRWVNGGVMGRAAGLCQTPYGGLDS